MSSTCHSERLGTTLSLPKGSEEESKKPENVSFAMLSQGPPDCAAFARAGAEGVLLNNLSLSYSTLVQIEKNHWL